MVVEMLDRKFNLGLSRGTRKCSSEGTRRNRDRKRPVTKGIVFVPNENLLMASPTEYAEERARPKAPAFRRTRTRADQVGVAAVNRTME